MIENDFVSLRAKVSPQDCITFRQVNYPSSEVIFKCSEERAPRKREKRDNVDNVCSLFLIYVPFGWLGAKPERSRGVYDPETAFGTLHS